MVVAIILGVLLILIGLAMLALAIIVGDVVE